MTGRANRTVNISKDNFIFAQAECGIAFTIRKEFLSRYTPCTGMTREQLTEAIAVVHTEFILIHPFREGNGRLSRLIADVMAVQSGLPPLDYSCWKQHPAHYIAAIHAALNLNYEPMKYWVNQALSKN